MAARDVLNCPMDRSANDARADTVREYLVELLAGVWIDGEGFSGKRPFGNGGWQDEIPIALIRAGLLDGTIDEDQGDIDYDYEVADKMVREAILELGNA